MRRVLRKYRVGSLIQLGILGYVALALPYWIKVACPHSAAQTLPPCQANGWAVAFAAVNILRRGFTIHLMMPSAHQLKNAPY